MFFYLAQHQLLSNPSVCKLQPGSVCHRLASRLRSAAVFAPPTARASRLTLHKQKQVRGRCPRHAARLAGRPRNYLLG